MDLHEAVGRARNEMRAQAQYHPEQVSLYQMSYQNIVRVLIWERSVQMTSGFLGRVMPVSSVLSNDNLHEVLVETLISTAADSCWDFFVLGWVLGAPEIQAYPRTAQTFSAAMEAHPRHERDLLKTRFRTEQFLATRFAAQFTEAGVAVSQQFDADGVEMNELTLANWCSLAASIALFCAYELGLKARIQIEEDAVLALLAAGLG